MLPDSDLLSFIGVDGNDPGFTLAGGRGGVLPGLGGFGKLDLTGFECGRGGGEASGGRRAICMNTDCCCWSLAKGAGMGTGGFGRLGAEEESPG